MREAIGATWIMGIVIVFVALFSAYLAFSINYSKAFRVKNGIIERIEKHNGFYQNPVSDASGAMTKSTTEDINDFITEINYGSKGDCFKTVTAKGIDNGANNRAEYAGCNIGSTQCVVSPGQGVNSSYCVQKVTARTESDQLTTAYYKVYVYFSINMPVGFDQNYLFVTTGETKSLSYPKDDLFKK